MAQKKTYSEQDIAVLKGLEPVQKRPGMYTRIDNPNHIIQEVIDNAQDEALAGHATSISVELQDDGSVIVEDNGRGIPTGMHPTEKKSTIEVVFTHLHAGGKFNKGEGQSYGFTGGLHGVGVSVTNALSDRLEVTVWRDGYEHTLAFEKGVLADPLKKKKLSGDDAKRTGTRVHAWPTVSYFEHPHVQANELERYLRSKAVLLGGARVSWQRPGKPAQEWSFPGGLAQYLEEQAHGGAMVEGESAAATGNDEQRWLDNGWIAPPVSFALAYDTTTEAFEKGEGFELSCGWREDGSMVRESYVNLIPTREGGRHETGLRAGLLDAFRKVGDRLGVVPKGVKIEGEDLWGGLSFVLSTKLMDPQFQNQTKDRMTSEKGHRLVLGLLRDAMELWLNDHPNHAKALLEHIVAAAVRRSKQATKTERKKTFGATVLPGKLTDCEEKDINRTELFVVEGDSAGGCQFGENKVILADDRRISFIDLVKEQAEGKRHFGYSTLDDGTVVIREFLHARLTKHNASLVKVHYDNGESDICTPDHPYRLRDGSYKKAEDLKSGESLMPLYIRDSPGRIEQGKLNINAKYRAGMRGYVQVMNNATGKWRFAHAMSDEWNQENGVYSEKFNGKIYHLHHVDFNKRNNDPRNLLRLTHQDHLELHQNYANQGIRNPEVLARSIATKKTDAFRKKQSARMQQPETRAILSEQAIAQWEDPAYKAFMTAAWKKFYDSNEDYRNKNNQTLDEAQRAYWADPANRAAQSETTRQYFELNPEARDRHSQLAIEQWADPNLREWRAKETAKQWGLPGFREARAAAMEKQYYAHTMTAMRAVYDELGRFDDDRYKATKPTKMAMKVERFVERFFDGNRTAMLEAVANYNHKVVRVEHLTERADVYDITVPGTHNYALASGVFVHNSGKQGRDKSTQAILPIRGKLLNTWEVDTHKALESETVHDIATAIGVDPHPGDPDNADLSRLRYGRIFIMADADVDGSHIQVLLLTLFQKHFPALVAKGHIWIARAPLFRVDAPAKKGEKTPRKIYALNEDELKATRKALNKEGIPDDKILVSRFKGLGEMNPEQLWETTMNPDSRRPVRIKMGEAQ